MQINTRNIIFAGVILIISLFNTTDFVAAADWTTTVDYGDAGYSETGNWKTWVFPPAVGGGYRYLTLEIAGVTNRKGEAFWSTQVPVNGMYKVEISYRLTENRTSDADFYIHDGNNQSHHVVVNQRSSDNKGYLTWKTLGSFQWHKDQTALIELDGTDDTQSDEADAVRWTLVEELQPDIILPPVLHPLLHGQNF